MVSASTKPEFSGIKSQFDYESAWSPTSPLDFRLFSSLRNPFSGDSSSSSRSVWVGKQKSWDSGKVGLSIVHSLDDDDRIDSSRILLPSPDSKKMIFGSLIDKQNTALEIEHDVVELQSFGSFDMYCSNTSGTINAENNGLQEMKQTSGSLTEHIESDIEDYTCVMSHGPNPKTTHFYGDQVLKSIERNELKNKKESIFEIAPLDFTTPIEVLPSTEFLSLCCFCNKKLDMSKDIYMYREYKAFCSNECRLEEINQDEEEEDENDSSSSEED